MQWTTSGFSCRTIRYVRIMERSASINPELPRFELNAIGRNPSAVKELPLSPSWVAIATSKPSSRAVRAIGMKWDAKNQPSVTRYRIFAIDRSTNRKIYFSQ